MWLSFLLQKYIFLFLFITIPVLHGVAQSNKANHWYFDNFAGVNFNTQPPVPDLNGKVEAYASGSSVLSDEEGNLLFYTDGNLVWNRKHELMPNGTDLTIGAVGSLDKTTVIVPKPGSSGVHYIFTANPYNGPVDYGLFYATVDLSRDNGYGDVTQKHRALHNPVTRTLTAVQHANGVDFWVIAHEFNTANYLAYKVTSAGVSSSPVVSTTALSHEWSAEQMKVAPDGSRIAATVGRYVELSDFNTATGKLSNTQLLQGTLSYDVLRGVEFSPNSSVVYAASIYEGIYQFDLSKNSPAEIATSLYKIRAGQTNIIEDLQLAPDGKIYTAKGGGQGSGAAYLGVINNPNTLGGGAGFNEAGFFLGGAYVGLRLPTFITSYFADPATLSYTNHCFGEVTVFKATGIGSRDAVEWNFGDPASGANNISSNLTSQHTYSAPGTYTVSLKVTLGTQVKTFEQQVVIHDKPNVSLGADIRSCSGEIIILDAGLEGKYLWSTGENTRSIKVSTTGNYWVEVSNGYCTSRDDIHVEVVTQPAVNLGPDQLLCGSAPVTLSVGEANRAYKVLWSTGETTPTISVNKTGAYWVEVTNNICTVRDEVAIQYNGLKDLSIVASNDTLSYSEVLTLKATGENLVSWSWDFGDSFASDGRNPSHTYETAGTYTITLNATNQYGCQATTSMPVVVAPYLFIPNIFTPNNDGRNDNFQIIYNGRGLFELRIYNRWGKEVYQANHKDSKWSGAADGVYFYLLRTETGTYRGAVTLVK
ncbi:PKD domain-containing protein [Pontibacter ruber]|uniref:PKD domain-containing protein n=1 Tax=Pontibacter ruber TaxID=1343895 RepID=A0ABW5D2Q7_9BACT|nr:PKD domain-containing protein [Pontibacter ruber]